MISIRLGWTWAVLCIAALALSGCDSSSSSSSDNVTIIGASGAEVNPDGAWSQCFSDGSQETHTFETDSGIVIIADSTWSSGDITCTGTETAGESFTLTLGATSDATGMLWSAGSALDTAPSALDGNALPDEAPGTIIAVTSADGTQSGELVRFIDDTGTPMRMYRGHDAPATECAPDVTDGAEKCYHTVDFLTLEP